MRLRSLTLVLAALLMLPPGAAIASSDDDQALPSSQACVSGTAAQAGAELFGSGTEFTGTSKVAGLTTALVMEPYIAPGTRHRLIAIPGGWCDAETGFNQAWKANGRSFSDSTLVAGTYARLAAAPYFDRTTVTSRSSVGGIHKINTHALTNGVEATWTIVTDLFGVRTAKWSQTAFAVKPFVAQFEGLTALDGATESYTRIADGLLQPLRGLPKNETDAPAAEVSYTHPEDNFKIVIGIGDSRQGVDADTDTGVSRIDILRDFRRSVQENYEDFYDLGFRASWAKAVTRFLVLQANGLSVGPDRTGYVSINDSTSAYCQACVFIADDFQIHMVSEFRIFLEALGYAYPGASDYEVLTDILGHEMFHNWQNNYVKPTSSGRSVPGSYSEGTARFQETIHSYSGASHQSESLVYAADANGCNGVAPNEASLAGGAFQTPAYSACNFWLPWYGSFGPEALSKLVTEGAAAGAQVPGANNAGKVIKAIEVATDQPYANSAAIWAAGLLTGKGMSWDPATDDGETRDWGQYLRRWTPGTLMAGESATTTLANGGIMGRRIFESVRATVTSGVVLAVVRDSDAGPAISYPAPGETIAAPASDEKVFVVAINPATAPIVTTIGTEAAEAPAAQAEPVPTTLYLDGNAPAGEAENAYLKLVPAAPSTEKSMQLINYVGGPNTNCAGNSLFPVFLGSLSGRITGDIKVTFDAVSTAGAVDVRVWPDVSAQACAPSYIAPSRSKIVALPTGEGTVEAVLSGAAFSAGQQLMIQITPVTSTPFWGRMFYGTSVAKVEFDCVPSILDTDCLPGTTEEIPLSKSSGGLYVR